MFLLKFICLGDHIPTSHHIDVILEGLTVEHAPVVSIDESKFGVMDIDEVEILILERELSVRKVTNLLQLLYFH